MDTPADRIQVIEGSLRSFAYGCLSLIPVLGLIFSVLAILQRGLLPKSSGDDWNPARHYLAAGCVLAWVGGLISVVIGLAVAAPFIQLWVL